MPTGYLLAGALIAMAVAVLAARRALRLWREDRRLIALHDSEVSHNVRPYATVECAPMNGGHRVEH